MELIRVIAQGILLMFLAAAAWEDWHRQCLSVWLLLAGSAAALLLNGLSGNISWFGMAEGSGVGFAVLLLGFASREAIGYGDGLLLAAAGLFLGWPDSLWLLLSSLLLCAGCSVFLIFIRRKNRTDKMAFAPFVLAGYVLLQAMI